MANLVRVVAKSDFDTVSAMTNPAVPGIANEDLECGHQLELLASGKYAKFTGNRPYAGVNLTPGTTKAGRPIAVGRPGTRFWVGVDVEPGKVYFANAAGEISDTAVTGKDEQGCLLGGAVINMNGVLSYTYLEVIKFGQLS